MTVWPGRGVLDIRATDGAKYATADVEKVLSEAKIRSRPVGPVHALLPIDADEAKPESLNVTITLQEGSVRKGTVIAPDGKPATGVLAAGIKGGRPGPLATAEFELTGLSPSSRRFLLFLDESKKLGAVQTISGDQAGPVKIELQPLGSITGEVARSDKEARSGLSVTAYPIVADADKYENLPSEFSKMQGFNSMQKAPWWSRTKRTATTDKDGRFRLEGLIPGLEYSIYVSDGDLGEPNTLVARRGGVKVKAGETVDVGSLRKVDR